MKKLLSILLAMMILLASALGCAEQAGQSAPPQPPEGGMPEGERPERPEGEMPELPEGEMPGEPPEGGMGGMPGGMGGGQSAPEEYAAVYTVAEDQSFSGELSSTGVDENLIHVVGGTASISGASLTRASADSTGGDASSFYGVGAAVLVTGGAAKIEDSQISTDAAGGAGVFAYGDGVAYVSDTSIATEADTSGGIHVAGGGTLYAKNLTVSTSGASSAAIRSDRGSGTMVVDGGSYASSGEGSPAVYVTADIAIHGADLTASGSEALCLEGLNSVRLFDCNLSGSMQDLSQNDNTWTVILYQSMSGDSEIGEGRFEMNGGTLTSTNGGLFYTTNTESEFVLSGVEIAASEDCEYFLRATGNANERGWGSSGANGANCRFTALNQQMQGDVIWDSISTLDLYIAGGSQLTGAVVNDESFAGEGGEGHCRLYIDAGSSWVVTGDSRLSALCCEGSVVDAAGRSVRIVSSDGSVLVEGESEYTVTVDSYETSCDLSGMGEISSWDDYAVEF